ncbi:MAG: MCE family protein [Candidatus Gastranaerophilales bacterium]|nr:MCE family protein [Candidatus Gastranaerophilales bacterium]
MKKPIVIEILIWITILLVLIGAGIFTYKKFFVEPNVYVIQFKDIDGITKGSPVRFMGINIGYVRKLKSRNKYIDVQIIVTQKNVSIPNGTLARVEFYGLGGSKSIELIPPDTDCEVGILTGETIRLNDVVHETIGLVEIVEMIEKYVKNINQKSVQKLLVEIKSLKDDKIKDAGNEMEEIKENLPSKFKNIKQKQDEMIEKIKEVDENVEKLNQFIKK